MVLIPVIFLPKLRTCMLSSIPKNLDKHKYNKSSFETHMVLFNPETDS